MTATMNLIIDSREREEGMSYHSQQYNCITVIIYTSIELLLTYDVTQLIDMILMINHN